MATCPDRTAIEENKETFTSGLFRLSDEAVSGSLFPAHGLALVPSPGLAITDENEIVCLYLTYVTYS